MSTLPHLPGLMFLLGLVIGVLSFRFGNDLRKGRHVDKLRRNYFRGLNYLLNEQPDKAIEVFLQIAEVDRHTVETHLALGSLFRRRGESDRAIRLHQNLIARPNLTAEQRSLAVLELGEDYMRAGLLDRAELLFTELLQLEAYVQPALRQLLAISQQEQDWRGAIAHARRLQQASGENQSCLIAHFLAELASTARQSGDLPAAELWVQEAIHSDSDAVRPRLLAGQLAMARGDYTAALLAFEAALERQIDSVPEVLPQMIECLQQMGQSDRVRDHLEAISRSYSGISPVIALCAHIELEQGLAVATKFLAEHIRERPSVRGLAALVELQIRQSEGTAVESLLSLRGLLHELIQTQSVYRCGHCGFGARTHHWQCPSCKRWETIKLIHGVMGD